MFWGYLEGKGTYCAPPTQDSFKSPALLGLRSLEEWSTIQDLRHSEVSQSGNIDYIHIIVKLKD